MPHTLSRIAATILTVPLLALSAALPADAATAPALATRWGGTPPADRWYPQDTGSVATLASTGQSTGVVLINTVVDYGTGEAAGTGLVLAADGVVVTNHHVVAGATDVEVTDPATGTTYPADVVGYDPDTDVAVLKLKDATSLATIDTDSSAVDPGDDVTAVGNSNGGGVLTAATGEVIDADTDITVSGETGASELTDLIEVDATVVPGDSGGALLDADGEVVGMNVAASSSGTTGYAIPIATVLDRADQILAGDDSGAVTLGYSPALGVQLSGRTGGLQVAGVVDGGAAAQAGVTPGSVITGLDGEDLASYSDLTRALAAHQPGDTVELAWTDATGTDQTAIVALGRAPLA